MTSRQATWIWKPLASTAFLVFAWKMGALESPYGRTIFVALCLSWLGDILLIPEKNKSAFLWGLVGFLLAHVVYGLAFFSKGLDLRWMLATGLVFSLFFVLVGLWLLPKVARKDPKMYFPVLAYMGAVSTMVVLASGAAGASRDLRILLGGMIFYLSDLSVARDRFVSPGWANKAWGLPLYYAAQFVLAATVS